MHSHSYKTVSLLAVHTGIIIFIILFIFIRLNYFIFPSTKPYNDNIYIGMWQHLCKSAHLTCDSLEAELGSSGRLNFFCEPIAAGRGGAENMAATVLMRVIQDCICSAFLHE